MAKESELLSALCNQIKVQTTQQQQEESGVRPIEGMGENRIYCLTVIGQIEGHYLLDSTQKTTKYEHVLPQLVAIEQEKEIDGLLILLNTVGGDVEAGLAIAELIAGMQKPTVSLILGGGHSIGVPLAVAAKTSFIAPSASMTVHPVRMNGLTIHAPQTYAYFEQMQKRICHFVCRHSKIAEENLQRLMFAPDELTTDIGTILTGEQAVREGLIDREGTLAEALACLHCLIEAQKGEITAQKILEKS